MASFDEKMKGEENLLGNEYSSFVIHQCPRLFFISVVFDTYGFKTLTVKKFKENKINNIILFKLIF